MGKQAALQNADQQDEPTKRRYEERKAHKTMNRIGSELLSARKEAALGLAPAEKADTEEYDIHGRDLLTALVKSNMDTEVPESQRMADVDVLARECLLRLKSE